MDAAPLGAWASVRGYFTPATLFLVLNLVIGTIALTSRSHHRRHREHHHHRQGQQHERPYYRYATPPPPPAPLARTSSVLDRLRSVGLYRFRSGDFPPEYGGAGPAAGADHDAFAPVEEAAAPRPMEEDRVDARAEAFIDSFRKEQSQKQVRHDEDERVVPPPPAPLARTSSVLDRLRSFSLYLRSGEPVPEDPVKASAADEKKQAQYGRSQSEPTTDQGNNKKTKKKQQQGGVAARMSKTSSEAAAPNVAEEEAAPPAEECVDARADDFINRFRQQLQLQRLNSLLNYKGEVLNRGGSKQKQ